jgi:hypothetical protein
MLNLTAPKSPTVPITGESVVGDVLDQYPWLLDTLVSAGFSLLRNRVLRNTLARWTTIAQACQQMGVNETSLLESLNARRLQTPAVGSTREVRHSLAILSTSNRTISK